MNKSIICISNHENMVGGGEHAFLELLTHLPDSWQPIAVVPSDGELETLLVKAGMTARHIALPRIHPFKISEMLKTVKKIVRLCRQCSPALIYANGSRAAFYAGISKWIHKVPVVWHCRIAERDPRLDFFLRRVCNLVIANSRATADRFGLNRQSKVRVVHNGLNIARLSESVSCKPAMIDESWKIILVVARVSRWKRHDLILSAFEAVAEKDPAVQLICVGAMDPAEPDWWRHLQIQSASSPASDRIHWIGQVDDVRPWYRAALVAVLASDNEPFGRVIVEAMASGVAVIANHSGGIPEIIRNHQDGLLVAPGDHQAIADAISKVLSDDSLRNLLVESARQRVTLFSLDKHIENMVGIFEEAAYINPQGVLAAGFK